MIVQNEIADAVQSVCRALGLPESPFTVEWGGEGRGDYACNVAFLLAKKTGASVREHAEGITAELSKTKIQGIERIEVAGAGFINFFLSYEVFHRAITEASTNPDYGKSLAYADKKVIIEYTDPNPFKLFHIGHLMSNTIGESLSRLIEWGGAEVKRANYQGDIGLHVAKALWGMQKKGVGASSIAVLGEAYTLGAISYESDEQAKREIQEINKKVYERSDSEINTLYDMGRRISLEYFETIYAMLGTHFDYYFFESETGEFGKKIVREHTGDVFEESDGAIIYRGEKKGFHTRVFLNTEGLPTYEAKELGLAQIKYERYPHDLSVVVTGNEVSEYFKVLIVAMGEIFPELAARQKHIPHGMLRLPSGKMSSRTGYVLTAERLIDEVREKIRIRIASAGERKEASGSLDLISVAALKYSILKQGIGRDIVFDSDKSISFTGDSGPYLQYTHARAANVLSQSNVAASVHSPEVPGVLERLIFHFPEEAGRAVTELAPQRLVSYANELAGAFNAYYAGNRIVGSEAEAYRVALTSATRRVLARTLTLLGMSAPDRM